MASDSEFNPYDPSFASHPFSTWDDVRETSPVQRCPTFSPPANLLSRYADVREAAYAPETFSSREVLLWRTKPSTAFSAPPLTRDAPSHRHARLILAPLFTRPAIDALAPEIEAIADALIADIGRRNAPDAAEHFTSALTARSFALFLGVAAQDADHLMRLARDALNSSADPETHVAAMSEIGAYLDQALRRAPVPGRVLHSLIAYRADERRLSPGFIIDLARLLVIAGSESTSGVLGGALTHLDQDLDLRARLIADAALIAPAVEEFLRLYTPSSVGRAVLKNAEISGVPIKAGERLILSFAAANRDPSVFPDPHQADLDRTGPAHLAFGAGIHRCLGVYFSQVQLRLGLAKWLAAYPDYRIDGTGVWTTGMTRAPISLPVRLNG